jgi:hypothetical protein
MSSAQFSMAGEIRFKSTARLPYGTEFTIVKADPGKACLRLVSFVATSACPEEIELESGEVSAPRFVVMKQTIVKTGVFRYSAMSTEGLDQQAEQIEEEIRSTLLGTSDTPELAA